MTQQLLVENGKIALPDDVIDRYGLDDKTSIRIIETRSGILLVPLTAEPMSASLQKEISEWQDAGNESFTSFPYESDEP